MPRLILIKPGETEPELNGHLLGRYDAELNENGRHQAQLMGQALAAFNIAYVGMTPLKRAISTAMAIEDYQPVLMHPVSGFQGIDLGDWDNTSRDIITRSDGSRYHNFCGDTDFPAPGGESVREVYARVYSDLVHLVQDAGVDETLALVLEETVLKAMICAILDLPLQAARRFCLDHGSYGVFERIYPGGPYQMMAWNCQQHLLESDPVSHAWEEEISGV